MLVDIVSALRSMGSDDAVLSRGALTLLAIVISSLGYVLLCCLYNVFFHPLRRIPGPLLARVSRSWSRIGNLRGQKSQRIHGAHEKYGPVVRVGPNEISFADPKAVRDIYVSDAFVKEETFYRAKRIFHENHLLSFRDPDAHKQRKKLLQRGFSQAAMLEFEPHIAAKIRVLLDQWAARSAKPLDVYPWAHWLGFDTVYHLMFDEDPGSVGAGEPHWIMKHMRSWRPTFIYKEFAPQLEQWGPYVPGYVGGYFRDVQTWKKFAVKVIERCRSSGTRTPFLQNALSGKDAALDRALTDSELAEESMGGMFGGSGTTANTFVFLLWGALRKQSVSSQLHAELRTAFPARRAVPSATECAKLPYLQAVINETLRCYPTIIATLPRSSIRDTVVAGVPIPKGVSKVPFCL